MLKKEEKTVIIWGAGKIGRGFVADLFFGNGYSIDFVDVNEKLVNQLNHNKKYRIYSASGKGAPQSKEISNFSAHSAGNKEDINSLVMQADLMAVVVFPDAFDNIALMIADAVKLRMEAGKKGNLNILICANILNARKILEEKYIRLLSEEEQAYARRHLGLVETLVIRVAIAPSEDMLREDELVVFTDSYPTLIADAQGFRGEVPKLKNVRYVEDIHAEEVRKMYTYNMAHAFLAYLGGAKGCTRVYEAITDPQILTQLRAALEEASQGLTAEFGFDGQEMREYCEQVIVKFSNPVLEDTLVRVGNGVGRKISRDERLVGPALICRKHGVYPYYLAKAVAYALRFRNPEDASLTRIAQVMRQENKTGAVMELCGLDSERDFAYLVARHYLRHEGTLTDEDTRRVGVLKKAFYQGYYNEKKFRGCAQAALLALFAVNGEIDKSLFKAASGLSGGMAITGDGSCGGYTAGILYTGKFSGRRYDEMLLNGDKQEQYNSYDMAQYLNDRFNECYGSVVCADIHRKIFGGTAYCLRTKEVRDQFEEAGAHRDKCTVVVANSCVWTMEALWEKGLQLPRE